MDSTDKNDPIITVRNLWKKYGSLEVLKGLNLNIYPGETLVILGRSGVGKSVLLRQLIGIEEPDEGEVEVNGVLISGLPFAKKAPFLRRMGMLFQGSALFDSMTVGENTGFYLHQHKDPIIEEWVNEKEIEERVIHALKLVGLEDIESKMPSQLSGGMRKRAALARLIVYRPSILLYDEPTTGLDPITAMQINDLINKIQDELKATSVVVTHDIKSAIAVGDRLAFHEDGKIKLIGTKEEIIHSQDPLVRSFLDNAVLTRDMIA